jgi:hypothetical protein
VPIMPRLELGATSLRSSIPPEAARIGGPMRNRLRASHP